MSCFLALGVCAQEPSPAPEVANPAATQPIASGSVDFGYRWTSDVGGNFNAWRSVVNLGEGPRLFSLDLTLDNPAKRWFDRADLRAHGWGGDPYNTARIDVSHSRWYRFNLDYRNIAYFNFLPSFANPRLAQGILLNQRSFDISRRLFDAQLDLLPGRPIIPYFAFTRDSGSGTGVTNFVADGNEYPVGTRMRDRTNNFRGGVRIEARRLHVTLEQGGLRFEDDQRVFSADRNLGNRPGTLAGEQLLLTRLEQVYGVRSASIYSKALLSASPFAWLDVNGQFLYSLPRSDVAYTEAGTGRFAVLSSLTFFDRLQGSVRSEAKLPHSLGTLGAELRPLRRLRIVESWMTDRLHNASGTFLNAQIAVTAPLTSFDRLAVNYNEHRLDVIYDLTTRITLRGGHRYVWGDALVPASLPRRDEGVAAGELRRHSALAGVTLRPVAKLSFNADLETASGDRAYFRTSLADYTKMVARARYQPATSLTFSARFSVLSNENPAAAVQFDWLSRDNALSLLWTPAGGKRLSLSGEYSRSTVRSNLSYLAPQDLVREQSLYRENAHTGNLMLDLRPALPHSPYLTLGGSFFVSSGSRPTRYYQPLARLSLPIHKRVHWTSEWRWYGFSETFQAYEGFRTHQFSTGLRLTKGD